MYSCCKLTNNSWAKVNGTDRTQHSISHFHACRDEPTAALDSQSEGLVVRALLRAMEHSQSMVMVTHRLGVVRSLAVNRVIVMEKGRIVEEGHPEDLLRKPNGWYTNLAREQGITAKTDVVSEAA